MTIYTVYYYRVINKLDESVIANAKDIPKTVIGDAEIADSDKNMILTKGLMQVIAGTDSIQANSVADVPDADFVSFNAAYSKASLEKFYENLTTKFQSHPPLDFKNVKEGDRALMSYYFENIRLPDGFRVSATTVPFHSKNIRALQYHLVEYADTGVSFYKTVNAHDYALKTMINSGKAELVIFNCPINKPWNIALAKADSLIRQHQCKYQILKDESVLVPELDFNIVKENAAGNKPLPHDYKLVEERIKLKLSAPKEGGPLEVSARFNTPKNYIMNGNVLYFIRETGKAKPYCVIYLRNPEILKTVNGKK
jgi:hypothetical protein